MRDSTLYWLPRCSTARKSMPVKIKEVNENQIQVNENLASQINLVEGS